MKYEGSCHCGGMAFEVEGEIENVIECNCSICSKKGYLLWFVPREALRLKTPESDMASYSFGKRSIEHDFCPTCGCSPFGIGAETAGEQKAVINVRCLDGVDLAKLEVVPFDGRSL